MRFLVAAALLAALPAQAARAPKPPADVPSLISLGQRYLRVEDQLAEDQRAGTPAQAHLLVDHWRDLHLLRLGFEHLARRGELAHLGEGRRVSLRHVVAQLLGDSTEIDLEHAGDALRAAAEERTQDLDAIARLARRVFDMDTPATASYDPGRG